MMDGMNINDILAKAKELQQGLAEKQKEAGKQTVNVSVGGGMVNLVMNGKMELISINIDPEIVDPNDVETLEDLVRSAINEGIRQSKDILSDEMSKLTGGIKIPGFDTT